MLEIMHSQSNPRVNIKSVDLTIVIPCLNEQENICQILDQVRDLITKQSFTSEIVVVDDQSDDRTLEFAEEWANTRGKDCLISLVKRPLRRRGYGAVVRYGVAQGSGRYCIFVSADAVDPIHLIPELYRNMEDGCVMAQCSRYLSAGDDSTIPFKYKFFQYFFRRGVFLALGQHIPDSTYAFKMFQRKEMLGVGLSQNRFSISPEITFKSILRGGRISYVAGAQGTRERGVSKFIFRKEGLGFSYCLLRAFLHRFNLIYWF
ncbi:glycosyltransferase [Azonexus sp. IMCC34842]|uniref:glycosyltransferase family 2 protein n=1 Tax=Azonexus sp. IMCC34842 TaxID=3420950 RepID=UPI003D0D4049